MKYLTLTLILAICLVAGCTTQQLEEINSKAMLLNETLIQIEQAETPEELIGWARVINPELASNIEQAFKNYETLEDTAKDTDWQKALLLALASIFTGGTGVNLYKNRKGGQ